MNNFHSIPEAKDFVVSRIVEEAQREGAPLSEPERKMLYFSESEMSEAEAELCADFDREYDQDSYEQRIAAFIQKIDKRYRTQDAQEYARWRSAIQLLLQNGNYIGVMVAQSGLRPRGTRPRGDVLKLISTAFLIVGALAGVAFLMAKWDIDPSPDAFRFWFWAAIITVATGYTVVRLIVGKGRSSRH